MDTIVNALISFHDAHMSEYKISSLSKGSVFSGKTPAAYELNMALLDDPTGMTFLALIESPFKEFLSTKQVPLLDLSNPDSLAGWMTLIDTHKLLLDQLSQSGTFQSYQQLVAELTDAVEHISSTPLDDEFRADVSTFIARIQKPICTLIDKMSKMTYCDGPTSPIRDALRGNILLVSSEEKLIPVIHQFSEGFTLVCISPPDHVASSYFVLVCKSGGRVIVISDKQKEKYPDQSAFRRNDRHHLDRFNSSPFPYGELGVESENGGRKLRKQTSSESTSLGPSGIDGFSVLTPLSALPHDEIVRLLVTIRYICSIWDQINAPLLHTAEHIALPEHLNSREANTSIALSVLKREPIPFARENYTLNRFTTEMYRNNETGEPVDGTLETDPTNPVIEAILDEIMPTLPAEPLLKLSESMEIISRDGTAIQRHGSKEQILSDLNFIARTQQAHLLKPYIDAWVEEQEKHWDHLATQAKEGKYLLRSLVDMEKWNKHIYVGLTDEDRAFFEKYPNTLGFGTKFGGWPLETNSVHQLYHYVYYSRDGSYYRGSCIGTSRNYCLNEMKGGDQRTGKAICPLTGTVAKVFLNVSIRSFVTLTHVLGLKREQLPLRLQYHGIIPYVGNSILDRVDPVMQLKLKERFNPDTSPLRFGLGLSVPGLNMLRKEKSLPPLKEAEIKAILDKDE